jgi:hypothetical protein
VPLFSSTDPLRKNDVLAANLLFICLGLFILFQVAGWISQALVPSHNHFSSVHLNWLTLAGAGIYFLIRGALFYGVRRGLLFAKVLVALGFVLLLYTTTEWPAGVVAGVSLTQFSFASLLLLLNNLLTLAALVLMFKKPQEAAPSGT